MKTFVITAAGGNPTAIRTIQSQINRQEFEKFGKDLMQETEKLGVEQAGFLIHHKDSQVHFEMSGGEFCGNASRSVALVISLLTEKSDNAFTVSGFKNTVLSHVEKLDDKRFNVTCEFPNLPISIHPVIIDGNDAKVVDLGGIVHVVIEQLFPAQNYKEVHRKIMEELGLQTKDAVGVVWIKKTSFGVSMDPVVWVRSIDTFFHETSCGSGTIAVAATTNEKTIIQPSGKSIEAVISDSGVILSSVMEIIFENQDKIEYVSVSQNSPSNYEEEFICLYKDAFGGPPYFEDYSDVWVKENVWDFHLKHGCIILALHNHRVVGLGCAMPVVMDKKINTFLSEQENLPFPLALTLYMSELAVSSLFRKSDLHIGSTLVKKRIEWGRKNGFPWFVMRTAAENSNSKNLYLKTIGAKVLEGVVQNVTTNPEEVTSASNERIYLYGETK